MVTGAIQERSVRKLATSQVVIKPCSHKKTLNTMRKFHDLTFHSKVCFVEIYKMLNIESLVQIIQAAVIQTT